MKIPTLMEINENNFGEKLSEYEMGLLEDEEVIELYQYLINEGHAWNLQGFYGRTAMELIESGYCTFGEKRTTGYYGQTFPSKNDLKPNRPSTDEFVQKRKELNDDEFFAFVAQIEEEDEEN